MNNITGIKGDGITLDSLTPSERRTLEVFNGMSAAGRTAWIRMLLRLVNGCPTVKAEALFWREADGGPS